MQASRRRGMSAVRRAGRGVANAATVLVAGSLAACGLFDSGTPWRSGKFEVLWIDTHDSTRLAYRVGPYTTMEVVGPCVVAAGADAQHVVIRRLVRSGASPEYFVVSKDKYDAGADGAVNGPLSKDAFNALKRTVPLPALEEAWPAAACKDR